MKKTKSNPIEFRLLLIILMIFWFGVLIQTNYQDYKDREQKHRIELLQYEITLDRVTETNAICDSILMDLKKQRINE